MKILHTSDWHAGKVWKGQSRLDELAAVLDDLVSTIERERIDLVLMTGDIFDSPSPPPGPRPSVSCSGSSGGSDGSTSLPW